MKWLDRITLMIVVIAAIIGAITFIALRQSEPPDWIMNNLYFVVNDAIYYIALICMIFYVALRKRREKIN